MTAIDTKSQQIHIENRRLHGWLNHVQNRKANAFSAVNRGIDKVEELCKMRELIPVIENMINKNWSKFD